ncbi:hypothetical protein QBC42DRAFT_85635 [Cladorrhinum samala]|uniref:Uncharacterized protein n=1 Tax=Cladorrhinum samala TaxID=585594 RepID=A0AAV9HMF2_9PEZI|nr:hypothetical protein QBC42DRAFT_85635 [Cladorrhinum samala]
MFFSDSLRQYPDGFCLQTLEFILLQPAPIASTMLPASAVSCSKDFFFFAPLLLWFLFGFEAVVVYTLYPRFYTPCLTGSTFFSSSFFFTAGCAFIFGSWFHD